MSLDLARETARRLSAFFHFPFCLVAEVCPPSQNCLRAERAVLMHVRPAAVEGIDITQSVMFTRKGPGCPAMGDPAAANCPEVFSRMASL
jgi:hypothetical protein